MKFANVYAFAPIHNTPGRHDATGAFQPEAKRYCAYHDDLGCKVTQVLVDNHATDASMRKQVMDAIIGQRAYERIAVAFFCHGTKSSIQFGFSLRDVKKLADVIAVHGNDAPVVTFYSCDVARDADAKRDDDRETIGGDGGFADQMRDELCHHGAVWCGVDGHTTVGHTTKNPYVRRFLGHGNAHGGEGGFYIISPGGKLWSKWRQSLQGDMRFEFPFMDQDEIVEKLVGR